MWGLLSAFVVTKLFGNSLAKKVVNEGAVNASTKPCSSVKKLDREGTADMVHSSRRVSLSICCKMVCDLFPRSSLFHLHLHFTTQKNHIAS